MTYNPSYIAELIAKHFIACLNKEEQVAFEHWLASDTENAQLVDYLLDKDRLRKGWEQYRSFNLRGSWEAIRGRLPESGLTAYEGESSPAIHLRPFFRHKVAVWLLLLGFSILTFALLLWGGKSRKEVSASSALHSGITLQYNGAEVADLQACKKGWQLQEGNLIFSKPEEGIVQLSIADTAQPIGRVLVNTPKGANFRMLLPDSSTVDVNADSRIVLEPGFGRKRQIIIDGEAYFQVRHQVNYPFMVKVGPKVTINTIGTDFNVKAYPEDDSIRVQLVKGGLVVRDSTGKQYTLESHQTLSLDRNGKAGTQPLKDTAMEIPWTQNQFTFNGTPIREVLNDLSRWYGVPMELHGEPKRHYKVSCSRQDSLRSVLIQLSATTHMKYKLFENKATIYFDER
jgi:transmembrane sensor